jgi:hypothetical protein
MAWIKRNLFFFIASILAVALIGVGGWYFYVEYTAEGQTHEKITEDYDTLRQLNTQNPHPGKAGGPVDNVQTAKDQQASLRAWIESTRPFFRPVPQSGSLADFPTQLDNSVAELQRKARDNGVSVPTGYYFTFLAQKNMLAIPYNILPQLASQLAEIKVICGILFDAKINALESIRREALSSDDTNGPDYLPPNERTASTPLADLTPYEVTFDCFSGELASVLGSFAASPYGLVVQTIEVEPTQYAPNTPGPSAYSPGPSPNGGGGISPSAYAALGGPATIAPGSAAWVALGGPASPGGRPAYNPAPAPMNGGAPTRSGMPAPPPPNGRPVKFLSENKLRITLLVEVVKPRPGR